jgi:4-amino-4-deoxy-L-arabinose transferase-like glycosyltransferase
MGIAALLLPSVATLADHLLSLHLSGRWVYIEFFAAVLVCGGIVLTAPCVAWWKRLALLAGAVCFLVVQVLALGAFLLAIYGMEASSEPAERIRQPIPGDRVTGSRASLARPGCTLRSAI